MEKISLGIDIGGTKLAIALVNEDGNIINLKIVHDHKGRSDSNLIDYIYSISKEVSEEAGIPLSKVSAIGLCYPGHIKFKEGITITASNFNNFKNYPLKEMLEEKFNKTVVIDNDANCQALAEHSFGAGKGYDDMVFITVSTGIGGGIIINNKLYRGFTGSAGEFGHMIIDHSGGNQCTCNNKGCWNICSAGVNLNTTAQKLKDQGIISEYISEKTELTGQLLKQGWENNDPLCTAIIDEYINYIAIGLNNIFQILNPPTIVMGGGLMKLGQNFLDKIILQFKKIAGDMLVDELRIVSTKLSGNAAAIGAAAMAIK